MALGANTLLAWIFKLGHKVATVVAVLMQDILCIYYQNYSNNKRTIGLINLPNLTLPILRSDLHILWCSCWNNILCSPRTQQWEASRCDICRAAGDDPFMGLITNCALSTPYPQGPIPNLWGRFGSGELPALILMDAIQ